MQNRSLDGKISRSLQIMNAGRKYSIFGCRFVSGLGLLAAAESKPAAPAISFPKDGKIDFEKHVQPIFAYTCYECHSAKKIKGKLRLDSKELAMKGGSTKATITPAKGKESYLV